MKKRIRITIEVDTSLERKTFGRLLMDATASHPVFQECVYIATEEVERPTVLVNFKRRQKAKVGR